MTEQDKQALIEYYCNRDCGHTREECCLDNCHEIMLIEEFPTTPTDTDTISRQAAIDALKKQREELLKGLDKNSNVYGIISASTGIVICTVGQLPSAQPTFDARDTQYNLPIGTDCISRHAAIELLSQYPFENVINCISILEEMPSAQSEIYHCIDCALYNKPQCLMAFENACWAEPYGYCHMFTRKENDEDERPD